MIGMEISGYVVFMANIIINYFLTLPDGLSMSRQVFRNTSLDTTNPEKQIYENMTLNLQHEKRHPHQYISWYGKSVNITLASDLFKLSSIH